MTMFIGLREMSVRFSQKRFFYWSSLQGIASSPLTPVAIYGTILVPFVSAQVRILRHFEVLTVNPFDKVSLPCPMLITYGFSLTFALAAILTLIICPPIIKHHQSFGSYLAEVVNLSRKIKDKVPNSNVDKFESLKFETDIEIDELIEKLVIINGEEKYKKLIEGVLNDAIKDWEELQISISKVRQLIGYLYLISFALGAIVFFLVMPLSIILP